MNAPAPLNNPNASLSGRGWRWRHAPASDAGHGLDSLVDQLLLARGVAPEDLPAQRSPSLRAFLPDPGGFRDMEIAAARLAAATITREPIAVFGDYDVDGATSAALLIRLLRALGHDAEAYIPDRLLEGYGPSAAALLALGARGRRLIITVDCGTTAHAALAEVAAAGLEVIVVDHHQCAAEVPAAFALINPNRPDEAPHAAAHGHLAAVGVAFLLGIALVRALRTRGYFADRPEPDLLALLDLVALGTVADVAPLRGLNRAFVAQGLRVMAHRQNIGLAALIDASGLARPPQCSDLGFALGPRINAGGRVGSASLGVRLLTSEDPGEAADLAARLSELNDERRAIEAEVQAAAEAQIGAMANAAVPIFAGEGWHPGVIGIVAGRLKEKLGRPCFVVALGADGVGKGSGRSIAGVDLGAAVIAACAAGLVEAGGGHAMAAGITLGPAQLAGFAAWLEEQLGAVVAARARPSLAIDLGVAPGGVIPALCEALEAAGPYGMGWPAPTIMVGPVHVIKADIVGRDHVRLVVRGADGGSFKAVAFRAAESALGQALLHGSSGRGLWLAGRPKRDDWGSRPTAELHLEDAAWAD